jgi:hypothetical protein
MKFLGDEVLTVALGETKTLTPSMIDQTGRSRASGAIIYSHPVGDNADSTVALRFGNNPDIANQRYLPIGPGGQARIEDYDNLRDLRIILIGSAPAKLFIQYFN